MQKKIERSVLWIGAGFYHPVPVAGGYIWCKTGDTPLVGVYLANLRQARRITHNIVRA